LWPSSLPFREFTLTVNDIQPLWGCAILHFPSVSLHSRLPIFNPFGIVPFVISPRVSLHSRLPIFNPFGIVPFVISPRVSLHSRLPIFNPFGVVAFFALLPVRYAHRQ